MTLSVELRPAYVWDCPHCWDENFENSMIYEASDEEILELKEEHGIEVWEDGVFTTMPEVVKCKFCEMVFKTEQI